MHLYKTTTGILIKHENQLRVMDSSICWDSLINNDDLRNILEKRWKISQPVADTSLDYHENLLPPIGKQEVWAAGVTYYSSRMARMEESKDAGGGDFYSRVYQAVRPEIFFKATPTRVVGPYQSFRIRNDSTWDVPEPELTLFVTSSGKIVGYTIGNDVSSRSIEGENHSICHRRKLLINVPASDPAYMWLRARFQWIHRFQFRSSELGEEVFSGKTTLSEMKRTPEELTGFLFSETSFDHGVFLMTGTGIVPTQEFTLKKGDLVSISIDLIGTLVNSVE